MKKRVVQENNDPDKISPRLKKLIGAVKLPADFDEKKELVTYFRKKHP
jgi:hypothetical protein